ncbi:ImuA family protein [Litoreibacter albidus]|uniref:Protein ImuA n=1 Tax=Litoreibacter albidus TaxID=670155 RepID=A0A1H2V2E8_9RHOB|nr:hypothetical protein [Litoreibacter albidus]SDW62477.1 protein ImuA [Litoreibacter albidus]
MYSPFLHVFPPAGARTHEVCGSGAYGFAFALAARLGGQMLWVREAWGAVQLNPSGFSDFIDPATLTICDTKDQKDVLAVTEEALRSNAVALVVITLSQPIGLTEGRRLQLAARDGKATGLAIIPEGMGSNAVESRWRCSPAFDVKDSTLQKWELIKNKSGTLGVWYVRWDTASRRLTVVSPAGE